MWGGAVCGVFQGTSTFSVFLIFPFKRSVRFLLYTQYEWAENNSSPGSLDYGSHSRNARLSFYASNSTSQSTGANASTYMGQSLPSAIRHLDEGEQIRT